MPEKCPLVIVFPSRPEINLKDDETLNDLYLGGSHIHPYTRQTLDALDQYLTSDAYNIPFLPMAVVVLRCLSYLQ